MMVFNEDQKESQIKSNINQCNKNEHQIDTGQNQINIVNKRMNWNYMLCSETDCQMIYTLK